LKNVSGPQREYHASSHRSSPDPAATPALRIRELPDATFQASLQDWLEIECWQLDSGRFHGRLTQLGLGGLDVCLEQQDRRVQKNGCLPPDRCTVSVSLRSDASMWFLDIVGPEECPVFFLPGGSEFDVHVPGGVDTLYVALDQGELLAGLRALDPSGWGDFTPDRLISLGTAGRPALIRTLHAGLDLCRRVPVADGAAVRRRLLRGVQMAMLAGTPANSTDWPSSRTRRRRLHIVRAAEEYVRACLEAHAAPDIVEICAHVGVSQRTLEYSFRDLLQVTPIAWLRILRLNRARRDLLRPLHAGATVTEVAVRHGFLHLGHFACDYRRQFGESPSATLRRARNLPAGACSRPDDSCGNGIASTPGRP